MINQGQRGKQEPGKGFNLTETDLRLSSTRRYKLKDKGLGLRSKGEVFPEVECSSYRLHGRRKHSETGGCCDYFSGRKALRALEMLSKYLKFTVLPVLAEDLSLGLSICTGQLAHSHPERQLQGI